MAKAPSFLDFYKALTANSQLASQARSAGVPINTVKLNYGTYGTEGGGLGASKNVSKGNTSKKKDQSIFEKALTFIPVLGSYIGSAQQDGPDSLGGRFLDVLARPTYASASAMDQYQQEANSGQQKAGISTDVFKAFLEGLAGQSKKTSLDVAKTAGWDNDGILAGVRNFAMDVAIDPTSYITGGSLARSAGAIAPESTPAHLMRSRPEDAVTHSVEPPKTVLEGRVLDELEAPPVRPQIGPGPNSQGFVTDSQGTTTRGLDEFLKYLDSREGRAESGMAGDVFQPAAVIPEGPGMAPPLNLGNLGDEPRLFQAGPEGVRQEVKGLPGPTPDVIAGRIRREELDALGREVAQFNYGGKAETLPAEGWWKEQVTKVPILDEPAAFPSARLYGTAVDRNKPIIDKYAYLREGGDEDLANVKDPLNRIIMSRVEEMVYPAYVQKEVAVADGKGGSKTQKVWAPDPSNPEPPIPMGELRAKLAAKGLNKEQYDALIEELKTAPPARQQEIRKQIQDSKPISPVLRAKLAKMLIGHLDAVKQYSKSGAPGFEDVKGSDRFFREMYGIRPAAMERAMAKKKPESVLPVSGPFDTVAAPKYNEIREFTKLGYEEKTAYLTRLQEEFGIKPEHIVYLSQASNKASFDTRLANLHDSWRMSDSIDDVADAIADRRIRSTDEVGIPQLLAYFKVKTLKQLEAAIRKESSSLSKAEKAMLGKFVPDLEGNIRNKGYKDVGQAPINKIREVGPGGAEYKTYSGPPKAARLKKQVEAAKVRAASVPRVEEIVQRVKAGDKSDLVEPVTGLSASQDGMFARAVNSAVVKNVLDPQTKKYPHVTKTGVKRTHKTPGKGYGRRTDVWNAYAQYDVFRSVIGDFSKAFRQARENGQISTEGLRAGDVNGLRAKAAYEQVMPVLDHVNKYLRGHGVFPTLGVKNSDTPVGMFDVFDSIGPDWVQQYIFKVTPTKVGEKTIYQSVVSPTQLMGAMDIGIAAVRGGKIDPTDAGEVARLMLDHLKTKIKNVPNNVERVTKTWDQEAEFMSPLVEALDDLVRKAEKYAAERKLYHDNKISEGTQSALDEIAREVVAPNSTFAKLMAISNSIDSTLIPKVSRSKKLTEDDEWMVKTEVNSVADQFGMSPEVRAEAKRSLLRNAKVSVAEKIDLDVAGAKESRQIVDDAIPLADTATKFEGALTHRMVSAIFPHFGNERIRPMYINHKSASQTTSRLYHGVLNDIQVKHGKETIKSAWNNLQREQWSQDPKILEAQKDLKKAIDVMFADDSAYSMFSRRGLTADELNAHFDHFKIHPKFRIKNDATAHKAWMEWDTSDPLDLLSKTFAASTATLGKKLLGDDLMANFASKTKQKGYVKIARTNNEILRYIDVDNYYFPREVAHEMNIHDQFLKKGMDAKEYNEFLKIYDEILHRYKSGLTIYRPGHHARNMVGDVWLSHMAGVSNPIVYTKGLKVMRHYRGRYKDFDVLAALARGDSTPISSKLGADEVITTIKINGKKVPLTAGQINRGAYDFGLLTDYRTLEDIGGEGLSVLDNIKGPVGERIRKPFGGKVHNFAATVSESRDHWVRLSHLIDYLEKGNFKSLDDAFDGGAKVVRKWHPDGSDLSHFEQNGMRRVFLFYSWIRKAIPLVLEGMVTRPGRAMMYPKAIYNMAEANGIDLESLSEPFPTDQLFPEWIREGLTGPITENEDGEYFGINPGIPMLDVLSDYGGFTPGKAALSSTTPLIKLPWEMITGPEGSVAEDSRTGIPYFDKSDYLDRQIPNANLFVNSTGRSLTQPWEAKGGSERLPEETAAPGRTLANFLSGLGVMPMSKPAYIKQAKREETARKREERNR